MKKWIYIGIGAIVVVIAIIIFGLSNLGPIIKQAVNSYGPEITKTELHVDDVGISIFSAEAKIKRFFVNVYKIRPDFHGARSFKALGIAEKKSFNLGFC